MESAGQRTAAGIVTLVLIFLLAGIGIGIYKYKDRIFSHDNPVASTVAAPEAVTALHDQFDAARKQIVAGDYAGAQDTLKKLNDSEIITQPLQNWVTLDQGLVALLQENASDARDWFKVVQDRGHYSNDPSDATLVNFFSKVGTAMASGGPVSIADANHYALDSVEALAPFLFALKDWSLGKFSDSGSMLALYLSSTPKEPFQWIADFKPIAQKYADNEAAYEKVAAAAGAADTPEKRADALKQAEDLHARVKGKLAAELEKIEAGIKKKSADLDPAYNQHVAQEKQRDEALLQDARSKYTAYCADFRFDDARAVVDAAAVTGADAVKEKAAMLKKADWLRRFKTQLINDINSYGYSGPVVNRIGTHLPDGTRRASDATLFVQTQFGNIPFAWTTLPPGALLAMASQFVQSTAASAPQQAADRQWLAGVFACEEGMPRDGHTLLVLASQAKDEYKDQLGLFLASE